MDSTDLKREKNRIGEVLSQQVATNYLLKALCPVTN